MLAVPNLLEAGGQFLGTGRNLFDFDNYGFLFGRSGLGGLKFKGTGRDVESGEGFGFELSGGWLKRVSLSHVVLSSESL